MERTSERPIRVVQWTTGNVTRQSIASVVERPDLELVGVYAHSKEKAGRDVSELAGLGRTLGIAATDDIEAIIALAPDCVLYMPLHPDVEHLTRLLRAGINVLTTASFLTGRAYGDAARAALDEAARAENASLFGSGINPGWADQLPAVASGICRQVDHVGELDPAWEVAMAYLVEVRGYPQVNLRVEVLPAGMASMSLEEMLAIGSVITAMPIVNAIPGVIAARPGIVTYADLTTQSSRHLAG